MTHTKKIYQHLYRISLSLFLIVVLTSFAQASLIGYWPFDGNLNDASGNGNDGTLLGGSYSAGAPGAFGDGQAISFTGDASDGVEVPDSSSLDIDSGEMTIAGWVNMTNRDTFYFVAVKGNSGSAGDNHAGNYEFRIQPSGNLETLHQTNEGASTVFHPSSGNVPTSDWHHIATTLVDGDSVNFFIDGIPAGTVAHGGSFGADGTLNDEPLRIGHRKDGFSNFNGSIDDLAIWDEALPADRIADLAAGAAVVPEPGSLILLTLGGLTILPVMMMRTKRQAK